MQTTIIIENRVMNQDELNSYNSGLTVASDGSAFGNSAEYDRQRQREICQSLSSSSQNSTSPTGGSFSSGSGTTIMDGLDGFLPFLDDWIFRAPTKIKIVTAIIGGNHWCDFRGFTLYRELGVGRSDCVQHICRLDIYSCPGFHG